MVAFPCGVPTLHGDGTSLNRKIANAIREQSENRLPTIEETRVCQARMSIQRRVRPAARATWFA
jgi:hypothetical protein